MEDCFARIIETASTKFGITTVKPYQFLVMQRILEQEDSSFVRNQVVILPTGTGKSLCFQIPAFLCKKKTIIIYPLLALMTDQLKRLTKAGIDCVVLKGGQTKEERNLIFNKLSNGTKIIITNPETLCQKKVLLRLSAFSFELFVVDEAHIIEQWGKDFRPSYGKLGSLISVLRPHQVLAFTATASPTTLKTIEVSLFKEKPLVIQGDADRENIYYGSVFAQTKEIGLIKLLKECRKPALVFCGQRKNTEILCILARKTIVGLDSKYYHAGLCKQEREALENWFMTSSDGVLFATCAYGTGIDKSNIRTVIHYSLPSSIEEYLQESGRAGRDGAQAWAFALLDKQNDSNPVSQIFAETECFRRQLLLGLGQDKEECSGCDICTGIENNTNEIDYYLEKLIKTRPIQIHKTKCRSPLNRNTDFMEVRTKRTVSSLLWSFETIPI